MSSQLQHWKKKKNQNKLKKTCKSDQFLKNSERRDCFELYARKCSVTELSGRLDPNTQIPSISILDEILLICKQPQVNSFSCARLSPLTVCPEGINTNMKNLDSILSRPHRRLSLNTNHITSHPCTITAGYTLLGEAASAERSIWGPHPKRLPFSGVQMSGGRGNCMQSWDEDLVNIPIIANLPSLLFAALFRRFYHFSQ